MQNFLTTIARYHTIAPAIGGLVLILGVLSYISPRETVATTNEVSPMIIERKLAIEEAQRRGDKTYSYSSRFTPGIGVISDPEAYKQEWEKQLEKAD